MAGGAGAQLPGDAAGVGGGGQRAVVLLVEDEEEHRYLFAAALRQAGYEVVEATDGARGLALARARVPDLIVMDLGLPVIDGAQLLHLLRARAATRDVPVIVVSAAADADAHTRTAVQGATLHLAKPLRVETLILAVERLLRLRQRPLT